MKMRTNSRGFRRCLRWLAVGAAFGLLACSDATDPPAPCDGDIEVSVAAQSAPRFAWMPACGISQLSVASIPEAAGEPERTVWGFTVSERSPIGPAVTYGANPPRATVWTAPEPLEIGKVYRVEVAYTVGGDVLAASGEATFTWFPPD